MDELSWPHRTPLSAPGDCSIFEGLSEESDPSGARSGGFRQDRACRHRGKPWSGGYGAPLVDRFGRPGSGRRMARLGFRQGDVPRPAARADLP
jgi:hypothetical protein